MKISELVEMLQRYPQDMDILVAHDEEGNGYHPISHDISMFKMHKVDDDKYNNEHEPSLGKQKGKKMAILWPMQ